MPEGHSGQSGRSSDADTLNTQRAHYLRAVLRRFGALTLPPGIAPAGAQSLALEAIAQPLRLRREPLAVEDLDEESFAQRLRELRWRRTSEPHTSPLPEHSWEQRQKRPQERAGELVAESRLIVANVAEALAESDQRRIVILGSPGSGKTTALKALVSGAARRALTATADTPEPAAPLAPLPLFISLPDLVSSGASSEQSIVAYLPAALAAVGVSEVFAVELEQAITNGQALICLDSLDEVAPGERAQLIARINAWAAQPGNIWVVGSRFTEYKGGQFAHAHFDEWELEPLDPVTRLELARRLLPAFRRESDAISLAAQTPGADSADATSASSHPYLSPTGLVSALDAHSHTADWGRNPLLFSLAAAVYARSGTLPTSRAALYSDLLGAVMRAREPDSVRYSELRGVVEAVALHLFLSRGRAFTRHELIERLEQIRQDVGATWNVDEMAERTLGSGVLEPAAGETYFFSHQTFQEYLAAAALARGLMSADPHRREAAWELAWGKRAYTRWTETLRLMVGVLAHDFGADGAGEAARWLRALVSQRSAETGDPGDLGLALALKSLREAPTTPDAEGAPPDAALGVRVVTAWIEEMKAALASGAEARQSRLMRLMRGELALLPPEQGERVSQTLQPALFSGYSQEIQALAAETLGELEERAPVDALIAAVTRYEIGDTEGAAAALGRMGAAAPIARLIEASRPQSLASEDEDEERRRCGNAILALGYLGDYAPLDFLVSTLANGDFVDSAAQALAMLGERAIPPLLELTHSPRYLTRWGAIRALEYLGASAPLEPLVAALDDPNDDVRAQALYALAGRGETAPVDLLIAAIRDDNPIVANSARSCLIRLAPYVPVELILPFLDDTSPPVRFWALQALAHMGARAPIERIIALLDDPRSDAPVRERAITTLYALNTFAPVEPFIAALADPSLRSTALRALGEREERVALDALMSAFRASDGAPEFSLAYALACQAPRIPMSLLLSLLTDQRIPRSAYLRRIAVRALAAAATDEDEERTYEDGASALLRQISGHIPEVRSAATQALQLADTLTDDEVALPLTTRKSIAQASIAAARESGSPSLGGFADERDSHVSEHARESLALLATSLPEQPLVEALYETDGALNVWPSSTKALGARTPLDPLVSALEHSDASVREAALRSLTVIGAFLPDELVNGPLQHALLRAIQQGAWGECDAAVRALNALAARMPRENVFAMVCEPSRISDVVDLVGRLGREAIETLVSLMQGPATTRAKAARALGALANQGIEVPLEPLVAQFSDSDPGAAQAARQAVSACGDWAPIEPLLQALTAPSAFARASAAEGLRSQGQRAPVEPLLAALSDADEDVVQQAAYALRACGARAIPPLLALTTAEHAAELRKRALFALSVVWRDIPEDCVVRAMHGASAPLRNCPISALCDMASTSLDTLTSEDDRATIERMRTYARDALIDVIRDPQHEDRHRALRALNEAGAPAPYDALVALLRDTAWDTRLNAVKALSLRREEASVELLVGILQRHDEAQMRSAAAAALGSLAQVDTRDDLATLESLTMALRDDAEAQVRYAAFNALAALYPRISFDRLRVALDDPDQRVRGAAAIKLAELGDEAAGATLIDLLSTMDKVLRNQVKKRLLALGEPVVAALVNAQNAERPLVRQEATSVLNQLIIQIISADGQRLGAEGASTDLTNLSGLVEAALSDPDDTVRARLAQALVHWDAPTTSAWLKALLGDGKKAVREAALQSLKRLKSEPPDARAALVSEALSVLQGESVGEHFDPLAQTYIAMTIGEVIGENGRAPTPLITMLADLLDHPHWQVRSQAAQAIGKLRRGVPDVALQRLIELRRNRGSWAVRQAADEALAFVLSLEAGIEDEK